MIEYLLDLFLSSFLLIIFFRFFSKSLRYIGYFDVKKGFIYKINNYILSFLFSISILYSIYRIYGSIHNFIYYSLFYPLKIFVELFIEFTEIFTFIMFTIFVPIRLKLLNKIFSHDNELGLNFLLESLLVFSLVDLYFRLIVFYFLRDSFTNFLYYLFYPFFLEETETKVSEFLSNFLSFTSIFKSFILSIIFSFLLFYKSKPSTLFKSIAITFIYSLLMSFLILIYVTFIKILAIIGFSEGNILTVYILILGYFIYMFLMLLK